MSQENSPDSATVVPRSNRIDSLTSMRFFVAALIFMHHLEGHFGIPESAIPLRQIGVSFFFVLSGFVLTYVYGRAGRPFEASTFFKRRLFRLYPLHWVVAILAVSLDLNRLNNFLSRDLWGTVASMTQYLTLTHTWFPGSELFLFNGVTWSMSVLVAFCLLFPLLLRNRKHLFRITSGWFVVTFAGVVLIGVLIPSGLLSWQSASDLVHFFPLFRVGELLIGMAAAALFQRWGQHPRLTDMANRPILASVIDVALILGCLMGWQYGLKEIFIPAKNALTMAAASLTGHHVPDESWLAVAVGLSFKWFRYIGFAIPSVLIVLWLAVSRGLVGRILGFHWFVYLGNLSFAIYLSHRTLILWVERELVPGSLAPGLPAIVFVTVLTAFVSMLLYHCVELPFNRLSRSNSDSGSLWKRFLASAGDWGDARGPLTTSGVCLALYLASPLVTPARFMFAVDAVHPAPQLVEIAYQQGVFANDHDVHYALVENDSQQQLILHCRSDEPLEGRLLLQSVDRQGQVIDRFVIEDFDRGKRQRNEFRVISQALELESKGETAYVRLALLCRDGLVQVREGATDRRRRGLIVWVAPDLEPRKRNQLFGIPEVEELLKASARSPDRGSSFATP